MFEVTINESTIFVVANDENAIWAKYIIAPKASGNIKITSLSDGRVWQFDNWETK